MIRTITNHYLASAAMWAAPDDAGGAKPPKNGQQQTDSVETGSGQSGFSGSLSMDVDGDDIKVSDQESTTDHIEVGAGAENAEDDGPEDDKPKEPEAETEGEGDEDKPKEPEDGDDEDTTFLEVPDEFKADDPEVIAQFDKALKTEDGKLKMDALSAQWWANAQANPDGNGHLTDATYDYLDSLGIPREMVQAAEAGQQALSTQAVQNVYAAAGGKANYDAALGWAAKGDKPAYTEGQREAFNRAIDKGGETAKDAIDLLMSRYEKASGTTRTSPGKSAGEHGNAGGGKGPDKTETFKSRDEWLAARKDAGRDVNKQAAVSRRYRNSPDAGKW